MTLMYDQLYTWLQQQDPDRVFLRDCQTCPLAMFLTETTDTSWWVGFMLAGEEPVGDTISGTFFYLPAFAQIFVQKIMCLDEPLTARNSIQILESIRHD